jgi:16S rRNA (adenine1518-N6/adenine1519-N6)-dimethyltransferase
MELTSRIIVKNLLKKYGIRPSKGLGQNFLIDKRILKKIIETANLKPEDVVLEIGPGIGTLTLELTKRAKKVITVEKDPKLVRILKKTLKEFKNIEIIQGDILKIAHYQSPLTGYKVVANLPYYVATPVIRKFLELIEARPQSMVLMVQKEVGQRICARPPKMSLLAIAVQVYADAEIISHVPKASFWPRPKVDAAIIKLKMKGEKLKTNRDLFFEIVKAGFSQPRKQILNNLANSLKLKKKVAAKWLLKNGVHPTRRAETLRIEDWMNLTKSLKFYNAT